MICDFERTYYGLLSSINIGFIFFTKLFLFSPNVKRLIKKHFVLKIKKYHSNRINKKIQEIIQEGPHKMISDSLIEEILSQVHPKIIEKNIKVISV